MVNLLNNKNNRKYLLSVLIDNIGSSLVVFVLPLLILDISGSVLNLSVISSFTVIPFLILGLPFGAIVDKFNIKKILYVSDFIRFMAYFILFVIMMFIKDTSIIMITIYIVTIISSCTNVINTISEITFISYFVDDNDFSSMNSKIYGIQYVVGIAIPIIGGIIYGYVPLNWIFFCSGCCFLISSLIVISMQIDIVSNKVYDKTSIYQVIKNILNDIKQGFSYLKGNPKVMYPLIVVAIFNILAANFQNDSLVIFKNILQFPIEQIGLIYSITSFGALVGTFLVGWLSRKLVFDKLFFLNLSIQFCLRFLFILFKDFFMLTTIIFLIDICQSILNIIIITNRQKIVEKEYLGRVTSIYKAVLIGINTIGYTYGGILTSTVGAPKAVLFSTIGLLILIIFSLFLITKNE